MLPKFCKKHSPKKGRLTASSLVEPFSLSAPQVELEPAAVAEECVEEAASKNVGEDAAETQEDFPEEYEDADTDDSVELSRNNLDGTFVDESGEVADEEDEDNKDEEEENEGEEEEQEEEEEEEEEALTVKLVMEGQSLTRVIDISAATTFLSLVTKIAKKCEIPSEDFIVAYEDEQKDVVQIDGNKTLKRFMRGFSQLEKGGAVRLFITRKARATIMEGHPRPHGSFSITVPTASPAAFLSGEIRWTKMGVLGKGSFGTVYEGLTMDGRIVAVKQLEISQEQLDVGGQELATLTDEINLMSRLQHRNIVSYYGCQEINSESGGRIFEIFVEHCHGGSITSLRKKFDKTNGRLSVSLVRAYTKQVLEGLEYLHAQGIVHRDIKGDNVLISSTGEAKLADFGCSRKLSTATYDAACKTLVGTPLFMAPEVIDDTGPGYSKPADIWSIGCLVLEMFGRKPWAIESNNIFQVLFTISKSTSLPSGVPPDCPPKLLSFLQCCFERDPRKRASASSLLQHEWIAEEATLEDI